MKKFIQTLVLIVFASTMTISAQLPVFNHLGADLSFSTAGIGLEVSTPITNFMQLRAGVSYIPGITFNTSFNGNVDFTATDPNGNHYNQTESLDVDIKGDIGRTQGDVILNIYPFGRLSSFFVAAGAYIGGKSIIKLEGHSDRAAQLQANGLLQTGYIEVGDYKLDFEENGNIRGALCTKSLRPYVGLGFGRPCPRSRVGFMIEAGVQFMGTMKVCQGKNLDPVDISNLNNNDDWQKWIDKLTVYPMIKLTISGRIF